jgi:hypothetical protein
MATVKQQADGGAVPSPERPSPAGYVTRRRRPLAIGLGLIAWPLLAFFVLAATFSSSG